MNARVIVVTSGKGGVGKTTTTANVGTALARLGEKVAVIDVDVGLRNLDVVMGLEGRVVFDLIDVFEGRCKLRQALVRDKRISSLFLLAASQTHDKSVLDEEKMQVVVKNLLEQGFSRVIIDSPAGIETGFQTAASAADGALVVVNPEISSVRDADRIIGLLEARGIYEIRLIVNRIRPAMIKSGDMLEIEDILEILGVELIGIVLEDQSVLVSTNVGSISSLDSHSKAGTGFRNIARRLNGERVPFMTLESNNGFISGLKRLFGG